MAMKRAAIGVRVHSGWGALVAVSGKPGAEEIVERSRVEITDPKMSGAIKSNDVGLLMTFQRVFQLDQAS